MNGQNKNLKRSPRFLTDDFFAGDFLVVFFFFAVFFACLRAAGLELALGLRPAMVNQ